MTSIFLQREKLNTLLESMQQMRPIIPSFFKMLRVRNILDNMHGSSRAALRRLIPVEDAPDVETARYPSALLAFFPAPNKYACLGILAEYMLRKNHKEITKELLHEAVVHTLTQFKYATDMSAFPKVLASKTTQPFIDLLIKTRITLETFIRGELAGESEIKGKNVVGHPDARTMDQIFEIKLTGELKKNWSYFLNQLFAYAALEPAAKDVYLVLPLQGTVLHFDVRAWANRAKYLQKLEDAAIKIKAAREVKEVSLESVIASVVAQAAGMEVISHFKIGSHMPKYPTLLQTVQELPHDRPSQIFVGPPQSARCTVKDSDIAAAAAWVATKKLHVYIHAPYIINLANPEVAADPDHWAIKLLKKNLEIGAALGCKGVVVHVGKYTTAKPASAVESMRAALTCVLEAATPACPLLLETPAGQGTELLKDMAEFIEFVKSFETPLLRACLDTCHVFVCGHDPVEFIEALVATDVDLLRLVHFNDSMDVCGACKDRHAFVGTGKIGLETLTAVATRCDALSIPMVVE